MSVIIKQSRRSSCLTKDVQCLRQRIGYLLNFLRHTNGVMPGLVKEKYDTEFSAVVKEVNGTFSVPAGQENQFQYTYSLLLADKDFKSIC